MQTNTAIGRLTRDIEIKYTSSNQAIADITIAIDNGKTKNGDDDTTFLRLTTFGKTAENVTKYCGKGSQVAVGFIIKNHDYEDDKGNKKYGYNFWINKLKFLSTKNNQSSNEVKPSDFEPKKVDNDPFADFESEVVMGDSVRIEDDFLD